MKVQTIQTMAPCSFGAFRLKESGAQSLAEEFVKNPELEAKFMLNIAKPLEESDGDVVYNGYNVSYDYPNCRRGSIVHANNYKLSPEYGLAVVAENYSKNVYRRMSDVKPTNEFMDRYPFNEIEAAKNIILDCDGYYNKLAAKEYLKAHKNETVEEKAERLQKNFGINA